MISLESIMQIPKSDLEEASKNLNKDDLSELIKWLSLKEDDLRYQAFLLLQKRSIFSSDLYPYWDLFREKLKSDNSYQRSIGLMLIAENARWDVDNKIEYTLDEFLLSLKDKKPITVRQCIQSLGKIALAKPETCGKITTSLIGFDLMAVRETMRKPILLDIIDVLVIARKEAMGDAIEDFILEALSGQVLDRKSKKLVEGLL
ncbi:MAG: hypothetical protein GX079_05110 [Tissierellia bacterium]|nr:hypothetical protein [Tissierellia bacterium]